MEGTVTWSMGKEAIKNAKEGQGILVENLVMLVQSQSTIKIAGEEVLAEALLEIFIKKAIAVLGAYIKIEDIASVAFTMEDMSPNMMEALKRIAGNVGNRKWKSIFES